MNYKDLFDRYKNGMASDEEKKTVEEGLEKYQALENYLADSIDEEIFEDWKIPDLKGQEEETKKTEKDCK